MIILVILIFAFCLALVAVIPIYLLVNFVLFVFHLSYHLTLLQAFAVSMLLCVIREILFETYHKEE